MRSEPPRVRREPGVLAIGEMLAGDGRERVFSGVALSGSKLKHISPDSSELIDGLKATNGLVPGELAALGTVLNVDCGAEVV